jgi:peptidoglycan/LPS O-acetylase OafA/YrhL
VVTWFVRRWNRTGRLAGSLGRASFTAYLAHAPVVVLLSAALASLAVAAEVKFVVVAVVGVVASFGVGCLATRPRSSDRLP